MKKTINITRVDYVEVDDQVDVEFPCYLKCISDDYPDDNRMEYHYYVLDDHYYCLLLEYSRSGELFNVEFEKETINEDELLHLFGHDGISGPRNEESSGMIYEEKIKEAVAFILTHDGCIKEGL